MITPYGVPDGYRPSRGSSPPGVKWCADCGVHRVEPPRTLCPTCADKASTQTVPSWEVPRYEPCVLGSDGRCKRWSHNHTGESEMPPPTCTDKAKGET